MTTAYPYTSNFDKVCIKHVYLELKIHVGKYLRIISFSLYHYILIVVYYILFQSGVPSHFTLQLEPPLPRQQASLQSPLLLVVSGNVYGNLQKDHPSTLYALYLLVYIPYCYHVRTWLGHLNSLPSDTCHIPITRCCINELPSWDN